ncbi:MAG: hypothetical protein FVQ79_10035 [Planctomycetes bacterium]|nr:hypothetical protein [Planctomycetota bacterium]
MIDFLAAATEVVTRAPDKPRIFMTWLPTLIGIAVYVFILTLIIVGLVRLVKYLGSAKNEQKLIRMELGKLAEEVHLIRKEIKGKNPS